MPAAGRSRVNGWLQRVRSWPGTGVAARAVFALDLGLLHVKSSAAGLYSINVANPAATLLIASVLASPPGLLARALSRRPLLAVGVMSYSLYIWQPTVASARPVTASRCLRLRSSRRVSLTATLRSRSGIRGVPRRLRRRRQSLPLASRVRPLRLSRSFWLTL
jgi:hypothetical protein